MNLDDKDDKMLNNTNKPGKKSSSKLEMNLVANQSIMLNRQKVKWNFIMVKLTQIFMSSMSARVFLR